MATSPNPIGLQRPPAPPPDVTGQQGQGPQPSPMAPFARAIANQQMGAPGQQNPTPGQGTPAAPVSGGANPAGAFTALAAVMEKLLKQAGAMNETFQPFADRALAIIQAGVAQVVQGMPGASQTPEPDSDATGSSGAGPSASAGAGSSFPG